MKTYFVIGLFYVQSHFFHTLHLILHIGCQHFQNKDIFSFIYLLLVPYLNILHSPTKIYMNYKYAQKNKIKFSLREIKRKKSNIESGIKHYQSQVLQTWIKVGWKFSLCFLGACSKREIHCSCVFFSAHKFNHVKFSQRAGNLQWHPISTFISSVTSQMGEVLFYALMA